MKYFVRASLALGLLLVSGLAFAQDGGFTMADIGWLPIGAGIAMGLAAFGATGGQGRATAAALEGIARNPSSKDAMFQSFILGLVFCEFQALMGFVIAILWTLPVFNLI